MIPTMTYFEQALSAPDLHFKRLRQAEPSLLNGRPIVRRTHTAIESEIMLEEHRYLLSLPFHRESIRYIEELECISRDRSRGPMIECRVLYDELTMVDSLGCRDNFDVVLQEIPRGCMLDEAVERYCAEDREYSRPERLRMRSFDLFLCGRCFFVFRVCHKAFPLFFLFRKLFKRRQLCLSRLEISA